MSPRLASCLFLLVPFLPECRRAPVAEKSTTGFAAGIAAKVGSEIVATETVLRIARREGLSAEEARRRAVADALFASEGRARFGEVAARAAERRAASRVVLDSIAQRAEEAGPPTDEEVQVATERRFWELDCPSLLRTTHAAVLVKDPKDDARAHSLAERIAAAVARTADPKAFREAALAVPSDGLEVRVEDLQPVARDGRAVDPVSPPPPGSSVAHYSEAYVKAAYAIAALGQVSPVVRSEFGYHVILAVARIPEHRIPFDERRRTLEPEILVSRKERRLKETLARAKETDPVTVDRAADELSEKVRIE